MPRRKKGRYGDYCQIINGEFYGSINIPVGGGKYRKRRKKVKNRIEARQWALAELDRVRHGITADSEFRTFIELAEWFKKYFLVAPVFERGLRVEGTKDWKKSRNKLDRMAEFYGPKSLRSFSEKDLMAYARARRSAGVTTATINRDFALMRSMFKKGHEADNSIKVPRFPINTALEVERDRILEFDEEKRLLAACVEEEQLTYKIRGIERERTVAAKRLHLAAIIIIAVDTAMRSGEIMSLDWSDVDLENDLITVRSANSKTQKKRSIGMTPRVKAAFLSLDGTKGNVFSIHSFSRAFRTACKRAKITDLHFHDLRHTATTRMIRAGIPIAEVMKTTGHTQMRTFLRYLNPTADTVQSTANMLAAYLDSSGKS